MSNWPKAICLIGIFISAIGRTEEPSSSTKEEFSPIGGAIGVSYGIGSTESSDMGLPSRAMSALSFEGLLGYRPSRNWTLGVDFDYRITYQRTSIADAGGTNLRGNGWLGGLGARYRPSDRWSLQGALYFLGNHAFRQPAFSGDDTGMSRPLGLRLKGQYFFIRGVPLSADLDLSFVRHFSFRIASTSGDANTNSFIGALGLSWHFGVESQTEQIPEPSPTPTPEKTADQLSKIGSVTETDRGVVLNLEGDVSFATNSAELSEKAREVIRKAAAILSANPKQRLKVEGHTDSTGKAEKNVTLSQARAESVKRGLVEAGVNAEMITAEGFGATKPVADNATVEGRAKNRRVEIILDKNSQTKSGEEM